jgi:hypothetical protein
MGGDSPKGFLNGNYYKIKRISEIMSVLELKDGQTQILTEVETLKIDLRKRRGCLSITTDGEGSENTTS